MISSEIKKNGRILVICTRRIGDVLLTLPTLKALRRSFEEVKIDILVFKGTEGVLEKLSYIDNIILVKRKQKFSENMHLLVKIGRKYDLAISLIPGDRPAIYSFLASSRRIGCVSNGKKNLWKTLLFSRWVPYDNLDTHTVLMNLKVLALIGVEGEVLIDFDGVINPQTKIPFLKVNTKQRPKYAVFHTYANYPYKHWVQKGWQDLANNLRSQRGLGIFIVGGKSIDEVNYVDKLMAGMPLITENLVGKLSLIEVANLLKSAQLYVGTDTAVTHLSAMLGVPTVAIFGPSNPVKWGPWPYHYANGWNRNSPWKLVGSGKVANVYLLQGVRPCVPCMMEGCDRHKESKSLCLEFLPPRRVYDASQQMLDKP